MSDMTKAAQDVLTESRRQIWEASMLSNELPPLPAKTLLRRVMPDDFRYGDVIGYTDDQMREYARAVERAVYERAAQLREKRGLTCLWSRADDDTDTWETACRHAFTIIDGTPGDNHMEFCCYCGRPLEQEIGDSDAE